jgi:succinate dehydrogenase/fumarate reductase flavoprotein subunit
MLTGAAPIDHPPFYGMRLWPKVHYTMGGIGINEKAEVIDLEGNAIPGLYAAGEMTGGVHGACRLGSCSITECLVFGRIAGQQAATQRA